MLQRKIACSLIADYLQKENFMYTHSVFAPETGFANNFFSAPELEQFLHIASKLTPETSFLEFIIGEIMGEPLKFYKRTLEASTQTDECEGGLTLDQKLSRIDFHYSKHTHKLPSTDLQDQIHKYKKQLEAKMKAELAGELSRMRNTELASVRLEEAAKYRIRMQEHRNELERVYGEKMEKVRRKEMEVEEWSRRKEREVEKREYEHRQVMAKDVDTLQAREHDAKKGVEVRFKELEQEKNKMKKLQAEYEAKLNSLERDKSRLNEEVNRKFRE
eukprot:TRINITY_DN7880_c0_g2_i4.p2 TRINITY_DN7880_c0_g2~~TRINITY_DN7880_c0_g2_i4.p2  ORF type:complete len:274 (+),score=89.48 TRINITY_DN7880_c0_g2_i4:236-1057(+)